jgi:plastocyanin
MLLIVALMALAACGGEAATTAPATTAPATGGGTTGGAAALNFDSGQAAENLYVPATAEATAGEVTVTFNNVSAQPHNWTLVKVGEEETAAAEALKDSTNYSYAGAIAQTKLIQGGAGKDTVTFTAQPGTYSYICTFPGHYTLGMKGTLTVK